MSVNEDDEIGPVTFALQRLRESSFRVTTPRRVLIEVLAESDHHLNSAEIFDRVKKRKEGIGRASVFRSLDTLIRLGIARPTFSGSRGSVYYLVPADGHHAHVVCTSCGQSVEIAECKLELSAEDISRTYGVDATSHLLEIYGLCNSCKRSESGIG